MHSLGTATKSPTALVSLSGFASVGRRIQDTMIDEWTTILHGEGIEFEVDVTKSSLFNIKCLIVEALRANDGGAAFEKMLNVSEVLESWQPGGHKITVTPSDIRGTDGNRIAASLRMQFSSPRSDTQ